MFVQVTLYHVLASMHVTMSGSSIREILPGGGGVYGIAIPGCR